MSETFDLLVVGGGMAGMTAAAQASSLGARVAVCEIANHVGGTALLSTGNVWTVDTPEAFRVADPDGDEQLWRTVRENLFDGLEWLAEIGVPVGERHRASSSSLYDPPPVGRNIDVESFMRCAERLTEKAGGWVLRGTTADHLVLESGRVAGARLVESRDPSNRLEVRSPGVVLATGGFQCSPDLVSHYLGDEVAASAAVRSNPFSHGAGLKLALKTGATKSSRMDTFYGVLLPQVPGELTEGDYRALVIHAAVLGIVVGRAGQRLVDESLGAVPLANSVAREGSGVLIFGEAMLRAATDRLGHDVQEVIAAAGQRGARFAGPVTRAELSEALGEWGYDGGRAATTINDFDRAITGDMSFATPRVNHRMPVGEAGLIAVEIRAAMTSTLGGIRTNIDAQALDDHDVPVPGLFAAGVDQGGYNVSGYAGGLARALVFGRRSAQVAIT